MTGKDPVLNKRIISIFINELGSLRQQTESNIQENLSELEFAIHKIKPSLLIFEMDTLVKDYENLLEHLRIDKDNENLVLKKNMIIKNIDEALALLKQSLNQIN